MLKLVGRDRQRKAGGGARIHVRSSLCQLWGEGSDDFDVQCADVHKMYAHTALHLKVRWCMYLVYFLFLRQNLALFSSVAFRSLLSGRPKQFNLGTLKWFASPCSHWILILGSLPSNKDYRIDSGTT